MMDTLHPTLRNQIQNAEIKLTKIEAVVKHLAILMDDVLGEECRYMICLETGAAVIAISPVMVRGNSSRDYPVESGENP